MTKPRWHQTRLWKWFLLGDDGEIVAEIYKTLDDVWHFGGKKYLTENDAKKAAEKAQ